MALKMCKECGTEVSSKGICPKCGKDQKNFFLKHKIISFILIIVVIVVIGGIAGGNKGTIPTTSTQENERFSLVTDNKTTDSIGTTYIEGEIKNNTDKSYSYVQVTFNLFDESGAQLGTAVANINNLEANGTWKYRAIGLVSQKVASYKLAEITGW